MSNVKIEGCISFHRCNGYLLAEGSLEVKLPTVWTDEKQRWEESEKRREEERRSKRGEKRRRKKIKKRKSPKKEDPSARKGRKVAKHCVFPMICGSGGSKSRLAKAAGAEPAGQMRDEKVHAVVARSRFQRQKCQNLTGSEHFWKLRCRKSARRCGAKQISKSNVSKTDGFGTLLGVEMSKSARRCGAKHISKSKCTKHLSFGALLEVDMSKKCTPLWREAHFQVKIYNVYKAPHVRATFGRWSVVLRGRRKGLCTLSKVSKTWGSCSISKNDCKRATFEEDLQRCIFRGRRSTRDMFIRAVRRSGRWFPERGCILEHQIFRFAKMILRDRGSTSYDLAWLFRGRGSTLHRWNGKIAKRIGTRLHSTFHF